MNPPLIDEAALKDIRLLLMDVDGVLTDGRLYFGEGVAFKSFHVRDGLGIVRLHQHGVETGLITGRSDPYVRKRGEDLKMSVIVLGENDKGKVVERVKKEKGLKAEQVAYIGDDINDLEAMAQVGVPIAVKNAHPMVLPHVRFVTRAKGGEGAVREVADAIIRSQRKNPGAPR